MPDPTAYDPLANVCAKDLAPVSVIAEWLFGMPDLDYPKAEGGG